MLPSWLVESLPGCGPSSGACVSPTAQRDVKRKREMYTITIDKCVHETLGVLMTESRGGIRLTKIRPGGAIARWNEAHPTQVVQEGAAVVSMEADGVPLKGSVPLQILQANAATVLKIVLAKPVIFHEQSNVEGVFSLFTMSGSVVDGLSPQLDNTNRHSPSSASQGLAQRSKSRDSLSNASEQDLPALKRNLSGNLSQSGSFAATLTNFCGPKPGGLGCLDTCGLEDILISCGFGRFMRNAATSSTGNRSESLENGAAKGRARASSWPAPSGAQAQGTASSSTTRPPASNVDTNPIGPAPLRPGVSAPSAFTLSMRVRREFQDCQRREREACEQAIATQFKSQRDSGSYSLASVAKDAGLGSLGNTRSVEHALDFYAIGKLIGKGNFGKVKVGMHKLTEELIAVKLCEREKIAELEAKNWLLQEVNILKRLAGHPNVIELFEVIETASCIILVMEFAACGDLLRYVRQRRRLSEQCTKGLFRQLLDGIKHIHVMGVVHRDIKLANLLLDPLGCLKIADFGVAAVVDAPSTKLYGHCGTPSYIAPEILLKTGYEGGTVDVWSAGVVLYAMLCGKVPFKADDSNALKQAILEGNFVIPSHLSDKAASILGNIIVVNPKERASLDQALSHDWLRGVKNQAEEIYGLLSLPFAPQAGKPEGARPLEKDDTTKELLDRVADFGFPEPFIKESLEQARFNHASATYHLLTNQVKRRRKQPRCWGCMSFFEGKDLLIRPNR